jgi:hypothetical protein
MIQDGLNTASYPAAQSRRSTGRASRVILNHERDQWKK